MAEQHKTDLTFLRCPVCRAGVACITDAVGLFHRVDGSHEFIPPTEPARISPQPALASARPSHDRVSMWSDLQAVLGNITTVEFQLGLRPEKPRGGRVDLEVIQMQLDDARATLGAIALALTEAEQ